MKFTDQNRFHPFIVFIFQFSDDMYRCDHCNAEFLSLLEKEFHTRQYHPTRVSYICIWCGRHFTNIHLLNVHIRALGCWYNMEKQVSILQPKVKPKAPPCDKSSSIVFHSFNFTIYSQMIDCSQSHIRHYEFKIPIRDKTIMQSIHPSHKVPPIDMINKNPIKSFHPFRPAKHISLIIHRLS